MERKSDEIKWAATMIAEGNGLLICAGAGMGVDSGLPDFRRNVGYGVSIPLLAGQD